MSTAISSSSYPPAQEEDSAKMLLLRSAKRSRDMFLMSYVATSSGGIKEVASAVALPEHTPRCVRHVFLEEENMA